MAESEKSILISTCGAHALCHYFEFVFPAMIMFIARDLEVSANEVIGAGYLLFLFYGLLALPWGFAADRFSSSSALGWGLITAGAGAIMAGVSQNIFSLTLALAVIGVGISSVHPAAMALISKAVEKRGKALGLFGIWGSLGITFAPLIGGVCGYYFGWRNLYLLSSAFAIGFGIITLTKKMNEDTEFERKDDLKGSGKVLLVSFVILLGCMTFAGFNYRANSVTLPLLIEEQAINIIDMVVGLDFIDTTGQFFRTGNDSTLVAGVLFSCLVLVALFGQTAGGYVADRYDLRYGYLAFFSVCLPILYFISVASDWSLLLLGALFFFFSLGMQPIENSLVAALTPKKFRSTAYGIKFVFAFGIASSAVWLVTNVRAEAGTQMVYVYLAGVQVLLLTSIIALITISRKLKKSG